VGTNYPLMLVFVLNVERIRIKNHNQNQLPLPHNHTLLLQLAQQLLQLVVVVEAVVVKVASDLVMDVVAVSKARLLLLWINHGTLNVSNVLDADHLSQLAVAAAVL
jgi:hypothetical protein